MKIIFNILFALMVLGGATNGYANTHNTKTWFKGWIGKRQRDKIQEYSGWHACYSNRGGSCGSRSLTTGSSRCVSWGVNFVLDFEPAEIVSGLKIGISSSRSWSSCASRSEIITCSPKPGWKGRAEIVTTARYGKVAVRGKRKYGNIGRRNKSPKRCTETGFKEVGFHTLAKYRTERICGPTTDYRNAYWAEKKWSRCRYVRA
jgi:hypothetical protein